MAEEQLKRIGVRLSDKADHLLRMSTRRRQGDLSQALREAILNTDWAKVEAPKRRKTYQRFWKTGFTISPSVYESLKEYARTRGVEVSALIDGIVISYFSRPHDDF